MATQNTTTARVQLKYVDIGANLTDPQFHGVYRGKRKHDDDFEDMLARAKEQGVQQMLVTGSDVRESRRAVGLARAHPGLLFATAGIHPCHAASVPVDKEKRQKYYASLEQIIDEGIKDGSVQAFGELGLDWERLHFANKEQQIQVFREQLSIATRKDLPLFLHSRACSKEFYEELAPLIKNGKLPRGGVVHSFTGTEEEMAELVELGFYIGLNGCSLKTDDNLRVAAAVPLERLLLETDGPWCEIRPSHASHRYLSSPLPYPVSTKPEKFKPGSIVRGRCEPCAISHVAEVVAAAKGIPVEELASIALSNTYKLFAFPGYQAREAA